MFNYNVSNKSVIFDIRMLSLIALFYIFLMPISIKFGGDGISANYLYIIYPIIVVAIIRKIRHPGNDQIIIISIYFSIFIISAIYQYTYYDYIFRKLVSFIIFMSVFTYMLIRIDVKMIQAFKISIIIISLYYSLKLIYGYYLVAGNEIGAEAKAMIGSQRYGFILILAIWIVFSNISKNSIRMFLLNNCIIFILISGVLLTYSRSGVIALIGSFVLYVIYNIFNQHGKCKIHVSSISLLIVVPISILILNYYFPGATAYYISKLFTYLLSTSYEGLEIQNIGSTAGYRIYMILKILEYISFNPFTGSGYLGVWIMFNDLSGSAHNQYFDVLFRTGLFGFMFYVFLLYRIMRFLYFNDTGLFWGFIGILIYGLFHETFKLSQGGFILSFILGMMSQGKSLYPHNMTLKYR